MSNKIVPMNIEAGDLLEHPLVDFSRVFVKTAGDHLLGIPEMKSMNAIETKPNDDFKAILGTISRENVNHPFGISLDFEDKPEVDREATIDFRNNG